MSFVPSWTSRLILLWRPGLLRGSGDLTRYQAGLPEAIVFFNFLGNEEYFHTLLLPWKARSWVLSLEPLVVQCPLTRLLAGWFF